MQKLDFQFKDFYLGAAINASGGRALITPAGKYCKAILRSASGAQESNGKALTNGHFSSWVDNVVWAQLAFDGQTVNFALGEVVTGAQSGSTGVIKAQTDAGATGTLTLIGITGEFIDDEALTGSAGGAAVVNGTLTARISNVDIYAMAPNGQFVCRGNVDPKAIGELFVDQAQRAQVLTCPWSAQDATSATEFDTGFDFPLYSLILPHPALLIVDVDATETIDVGLLASETAGDADGFLAAVTVATAGLVQGLILNGANTMGALFERQDSANSGDLVPAAHAVTGSNARSLTYTTSSGSDTGAGLIHIPYVLGGTAIGF